MSRATGMIRSAMAVVGLTAAACGGPQHMASAGTLSEHAESRPAQQGPPTLAKVAQVCRAVQESNEIPAGCTIQHIDGALAMILVFGHNVNPEAATALAQHVAGPFCSAANAANRRGVVALFAESRPVSRIECETAEVFDAAEQDHAAIKEELTSALIKCQQIQSSSAPLHCSLETVDGLPAIVFAFANEEDARQYQQLTTAEVAAPFCDAITRVQKRGAVFQFVAGTKGRRFGCESSGWTDWLDIRKAPSQPSPAPAPGAPSRPAESGWRTVAAR